MSLLLSNSNPYEFIAYVSFGDSQQAVRYDISDISLNVWNFEPIYGAIIHTPQVQAPIPQQFYLPESFFWQYPAHGPVIWETGVRECNPVETVHAPEPGTLATVVCAFLLLIVIRMACRPKWGKR